MSFFSEAIAAARRKERLRMGLCFFADFQSGAFRAWDGVGALESGGHTWLGSGGLIGVSDLSLAAQGFAASFHLVLSGLPDAQFDAYAKLMMADLAEFRGRRVVVSLQFFGDDWQPLDAPYAIQAGFMDRPIFSMREGQRAITLQCEGPLVTRRRPRFSNYTDADQQRRSPGDKGLEFTPTAAVRNVKQPVV